MRTYYVVLDWPSRQPSYSCEVRASDEKSAVWMATREAHAMGWDGEPIREKVREA